VRFIPWGPFWDFEKGEYESKEFNLENLQWSYGWLIEATLGENKKGLEQGFKAGRPFCKLNINKVNKTLTYNDHVARKVKSILHTLKSM